MVEIAKIPKFKCDILSNFQTLCTSSNGILNIIKNEFLSKKSTRGKLKFPTVAIFVEFLRF